MQVSPHGCPALQYRQQPGAVVYGPGGIAVGRDGDWGGGYFQGSVSDVAIYTHVLSTARIQAHYTLGSGTAPPPAAPTGLYWRGSFQAGDFSQWSAVHDGTGLFGPCGDCGNTAASIVGAPVHNGRYAAQLQRNAGGYRVEVGDNPSENRGSDGDDSYYGFAVYFPSSNSGNWAADVWDWNGWFQFIAIPDGEPIAAGVDTGDYDVWNPHLFVNINIDASGKTGGRIGGRWTDPQPIPYDSWIDFVFHVRWSTATSGVIEIWKDGVQIVAQHNVRTLVSNPAYMEIQNYGSSTAGTTDVVFDDVRVGTSYTAVDPENAS